jgi:NADH-quinone oxidoreductase subunit M
VIFGQLKRDKLKKIIDLESRETFVFLPIMLLVIFLGVYPSVILDAMHVSVEHLISQVMNR